MHALLLVLAMASADVAAELKKTTNELLAAIAPGDVKVWEKYAHERLIYSTEANEVLTSPACRSSQPLSGTHSIRRRTCHPALQRGIPCGCTDIAPSGIPRRLRDAG